ncbi:MAG TPA: efflux RND transporter periplasmic adaptor subunit [Acidobacteriaceae bacterium]|jgi:multidrug efflux system membrane fusion protein|nr:efflux RND transporter periplasmic adaptor subunit [Acidobacteriaceae bacterium]
MSSQPSASIAPPDRQLPPTTDPPTRKRRHRWIWAVVLLAFGLLFYWVITTQHKSQQAAMGGGGGRRGMMAGAIVPVVPATAKTGSLGIYLEAIGTVTPVYTASLTAQVTGVITEVHYREGQIVKKGDPLIDIDARPYEAQLAEAQGALERDQNLLAEAQMDLTRYQQAWAKNAIPRQTLEDQEKLVGQDQGTVKNDEATVQYNTVQVSYCHIVSPITGRVGLRLMDPGNLVTANSTTTLVVVTQLQPMTVIFTLAEDNLGQVVTQMRHGKQLNVDALDRDRSTTLANGKLMTIDNQIDTTTGTVKARAQFANANDALFPNQFVNTRLLVNTLDNQIMVPSSAIQHNGDVAFVYLIKPGPGKPPPAEGSSSSTGNENPSGGAKKGGKRGGGSGTGGGNQGGSGSAQKAQYHVEVQNVKTGVTDNGWTAVQGIPSGTEVANSSFDKLQDQADVSISKVGIPDAQTTITGESNAP